MEGVQNELDKIKGMAQQQETGGIFTSGNEYASENKTVPINNICHECGAKWDIVNNRCSANCQTLKD